MAKPELTIKFKADSKSLEQALKNLKAGTDQLKQATVVLTKSQKKNNQNQELASATIKQNIIEFNRLKGRIDLSSGSLKSLGLNMTVVTKASQGNSKALALITKAYNRQKRDIKEVLDVNQKKLAQDKKVVSAEKKKENAVKKSTKAITKAKAAQDKLTKATKRGTKNLRIQTGAFATLRSNLLLYSFGVGLAQAALISFVEKSSKLEDLERGFRGLVRSIGGSADSLDKLKKATDNTVSSADLLREANNAMMLGVVKSDEEMAQLFDTAQRLGQALGVDTKDAINSIVTGMGRQSKLMLDNLGIVIKADDAYERYAQKIKVSKDELTDLQKKEAFNQEVLRVSKNMVEQLGIETFSTQQKLQMMRVATEDISVEMGKVLTPVVNALTILLVKLSENLDAEAIRKYGTAVIGVGTAYVIMSKSTKKAIKASIAFTKSNKKMLAVMLAVGAVVEILDRQFDFFELDEIENDLNNLNTEFENSEDIFKETANALNELNRETKLNISQLKLKNAEDGISGTIGEKLQILAIKKAAAEKMINEELGNQIEAQAQLNDINTEIHNTEMERHQQKIANAVEMANALANVMQTSADLEMQQSKRAQKEAIDATNSIRNERIRQIEIKKINDKFAAEQEKINEKSKRAKRTQTVINTAVGIMEVWADKSAGLFTKIAMSALVAAAGAQQIKTIDAQKYQYGGLVGGRRHSQGGTMIEAEQGEFVMSREATEAVGIENLNRMNTGLGGGGGASIVINNPILGKDTIEDEIVPQIKEALRRGGSIA
tara:strand:- start:5819 stop:8146 length:2328 start_codon:yes stop_codon:yes gene_type:complete